jgi:hypothetical protein
LFTGAILSTKQVVYLEEEKSLRENNILQLGQLLHDLEASEHWFDFESPLKRILSSRAKEGPSMDDYETLAMLQERMAALRVGEQKK